jgi:hypothetical protein
MAVAAFAPTPQGGRERVAWLTAYIPISHFEAQTICLRDQVTPVTFCLDEHLALRKAKKGDKSGRGRPVRSFIRSCGKKCAWLVAS